MPDEVSLFGDVMDSLPAARRASRKAGEHDPRPRRRVAESSPSYPTVETFLDALDQAEPRPDDADDAGKLKKNYAERLSNKLAVLVANRMRATGEFPGILPNPDGSGRETGAASGAAKKLKKTDVRFSTFDTGLELLVSIKTYSFRDWRKDKKTGQVVLGRYTKNMVRNDHELRAEAMDHHERHPYAVLVALFFLPMRACDDAGSDKSSFAHAIMTFRQRAGRVQPTDPHQLFERFFVGLYELDEENRGAVWFFDVTDRPPRRGRPRRQDPAKGEARRGLLTLDEMIGEVVKTYGIRNRRYIEWADDDLDAAPELVAPVDTGADVDDDEEETT
jgi:hypothetical protein